ncbi:Lsr2-like DNA bridging protein [Streptomyces phage Daubenski]|uniref:Lsr2-like DNA bridging protein n=1 Tax=Streptomyces phage Daubenski TaxID=2653725 RepID=A0A5Q2WI06_9CAUD|nr:Lsr2-like DNA bridging protein [Streptomyces phage Daubenski]YP_010104976.1 Lsr2-like DNA bridging protein [Streptomyces phage Daubenski]QGH76319.1 Lsr2-like DNA bridging protein [Streptomyces phage Daubenski]QGH76517.1 Lsr2-like DNA bridging protein [Streptomyces phage Daubenski]
MNMTRRAYAASLGLAKADARGRMSAEAHAAIAKAEGEGKVFSDTNATPRKVVASAPKAGQFDAKTVRAWAASKGLTVSARGRLSAEVLAAYKADNPDVKPAEPGVHVKVTGKDVRPHAAPTRSSRTEYTAWYGNKRIVLSEREVCKCGYSLSHCHCGSPVVLGMDVEVHTR